MIFDVVKFFAKIVKKIIKKYLRTFAWYDTIALLLRTKLVNNSEKNSILYIGA